MEEKIQNLLSENKATDVTEINLDGCSGPFKFQCLQQFSNLEYLSLKNSSISSLRGFPKLPNLKKLDLSNNKLSSTIFFLHGCPQMTHLNLSNNKIKDISALKTLGKLKNLQSLLLVNCEIAHTPEYRKRIFHMIKNLKDLDGEDKTMEDAEEPKVEESEQKNDSVNGSNPKKGKKRKIKSTDSPQKKSKFLLPQKNALMQLNELKPGLKYVVESISGPAHNPNFVVSVEVNGYNYKGHGNSKQLAKHAAAQLALASFVQYSDTPKAIIALNQSVEAIDFTTDVKNEAFSFNEPEQHKNGSDIQLIEPSLKNSIPKNLTEAAKKNPVMLLNEIHPGLDYKLIEENSSIPSQRFCMSVEIDGVTYEGTGPNKKQAKASAARSVLSNLYKVSYNMQGLSQSIPNSFDAELYNFPQAVADKVSKLLLSTFKEIMTGNAEHAKWKIIAGVAMTTDGAMEDIKVISFATGTKCINGEHISMIGANLNDCHAEIISRRCLKDFFYTNLEYHITGQQGQSIFLKKENGGFRLKPQIKFHLYISTAPCGDARIFCPHEEEVMKGMDRHPNRNSRGVLRTKIESGEGTIPIRSGQSIQTWDGILPGQERLLTMSCSDKIASWNVLGLQGALLSHFIEPIYLDSVILGGLFHPNHLRRALFGRFENSIEDLPPSFKINKPKMCVISSPETRHLAKSPNFSVNWTTGLERAEIVNAITGKTEGNEVSRLAKRAFFQRFLNIYNRIPHITDNETPKQGMYVAYKNVVKHYQEAKKALALAFTKADLGNWVKKPIEQNEFELR